jgi:serine/threonine protein kinase
MKFTSEIGILKGKFSYMSPEQIRGMPLDARTDVFSAGIILHEMLTTAKLFRGDTEFALMEKVRKAEVPPPSSFNRRVTPELDAIVLRALARDVADRYQSAAQLARDLDTLIEAYRFDPKELRQLMRQLFRKEYAEELHDSSVALSADPVSVLTTQPLAALRAGSEPAAVATGTTPIPAIHHSTVASATGVETPPALAAAGTVVPPGDPERRGFWASLFKKRK